MDVHEILRHGYFRVALGLKGLEVTIVATDPDWEPTREYLIDTASDVRDMYPGMSVSNVNWIRERSGVKSPDPKPKERK